MLGEVDVLDFILAEKLGMSLGQVRALPNSELVEWAAFETWRGAMADFRRQEVERRG